MINVMPCVRWGIRSRFDKPCGEHSRRRYIWTERLSDIPARMCHCIV